MNIVPILESILFVASEPLSKKNIAKALSVSVDDIDTASTNLLQKYSAEAGIHIVDNGTQLHMVSNPHYAEHIDSFVKKELFGELSKAQLETLTVIAYRSPITRPELEDIRGVNCAVILRNLMIRNLIIEEMREDSVLPFYRLSLEAMQYIGISSVEELPDYDALRHHDNLDTHDEEEQL